MSLTYDIRPGADRTTLVLQGRIDREATGALENAYLECATGRADQAALALDFSGVDYINSTGIALIVGLLGRARADGRAVVAEGLSEHYRHIFAITRLSDFMTIVDPTESRRTP